MNPVSSIESIVFCFTLKFFVNDCSWIVYRWCWRDGWGSKWKKCRFQVGTICSFESKNVRIQVSFSLPRLWKCYTTCLPYVFSILFCRRDIQSLINLAGGKVTQANRVSSKVGRLCRLQLYFISGQGRNLFTLLTRCELKRENSVTQWRMQYFFFEGRFERTKCPKSWTLWIVGN